MSSRRNRTKEPTGTRFRIAIEVAVAKPMTRAEAIDGVMQILNGELGIADRGVIEEWSTPDETDVEILEK